MRIHLCVRATMPNKKNKKASKTYKLREHTIRKQWRMKRTLIFQRTMIKIIMEIWWNKVICLVRHIIQVKDQITFLIQNMVLLPHPICIRTIPTNFKTIQAINRAHWLQLMYILLMIIKLTSGMLRKFLRKCQINIITILHSILEKVF